MAERTIFLENKGLRLGFLIASIIIAKHAQNNEQHKANNTNNGSVSEGKHIQGGDCQGVCVEGGKFLLGTEELMQHS